MATYKGVKLTPEQINTLTEAEHTLSAVLTDLDKAEKCGTDCQEMRSIVQQAIAQSLAVKEHFRP